MLRNAQKAIEAAAQVKAYMLETKRRDCASRRTTWCVPSWKAASYKALALMISSNRFIRETMNKSST